jgi:hypothetical protein
MTDQELSDHTVWLASKLLNAVMENVRTCAAEIAENVEDYREKARFVRAGECAALELLNGMMQAFPKLMLEKLETNMER